MDKKKRLITMVVTLLVLTIGVTFAYFMARTGEGKQAGTTITTGTVDDLKFNVSKENLSLNINQFNFASGSGNLSDNVTATASLKANSTKKTATYNYYVYFQIESNNYVYTTTDKKPEIVLSITGPNGEITSVDGLTYVSATNADGTIVKGFDITESKPSVVKIANAYEISSSSSTNYTNQEWNFKVTFINLDTNQSGNQNKNLTGKVLLQQEKIILNLSDVAKSGDNLATALRTLGTKGDSSIIGLYYHDANLTNGAGDNSYRYAGAGVYNYICLGFDSATCSDDNLYRIVGVFGDNNHGVSGQQLVKVIKNTSYGSYKWNSARKNDWSTASLNPVLNNTFKTEKLSEIENKIAEVTWKVSGFKYSSNTAKEAYALEITNATAVYTAKIGLIYASDYGFATTPEYWTNDLNKYDNSNSKAYMKNWLYLGVSEWLLTPRSGFPTAAWLLYNTGNINVNFGGVAYPYPVRPSFYLTADVQYASGSGTLTNPYRIS